MSSLADEVSELLLQKSLMLATAESCTGGLIAKIITDRAGSSSLFDCGFVTYSNDSKIAMLGIDPAIINDHGAVSAAVATAMAEGALRHSRANVTLSCTGIAGPSGGTKEKPVGLVYLALASHNSKTTVKKHNFSGTREEIRQKTAHEALIMLRDYLLS